MSPPKLRSSKLKQYNEGTKDKKEVHAWGTSVTVSPHKQPSIKTNELLELNKKPGPCSFFSWCQWPGYHAACWDAFVAVENHKVCNITSVAFIRSTCSITSLFLIHHSIHDRVAKPTHINVRTWPEQTQILWNTSGKLEGHHPSSKLSTHNSKELGLRHMKRKYDWYPRPPYTRDTPLES